MNPPTAPHEKKTRPPVTLRRMADGSYRIYGLRNHSRIHLTKEMRPWRRDEEPVTGETFYTSWSQQEAEVYAAVHGLTILGPMSS